jgi:large subunit ribosomal protein L30
MPRTFIKSPTKGPAKTPKTLPMTNGKLRIKQVRSGIGKPQVQKDTLEALGLKHHQAEVVHQDSPSLRGQIKRVRHLLEVTPVAE